MDECIAWLIRHKALLPSDAMLLDVGAYHGQFAARSLEQGLFAKACLFEPNPENLEILKQIHFSKAVTIIEAAVSDVAGVAEFRCDRSLATGSLLPYCETAGWQCKGKVDTLRVAQITLDDFSSSLSAGDRIGFIKIDTQGADLRVLRGAQRILESHRPWLAVEMIFVPLYDGQSDPREIWEWCALRNYVLGALIDDHYSSDGWLSYADAVFVPRECAGSFLPPFQPRKSLEQEAEIEMLRRVCEERLELINRLHEEAGKRLEIIIDLERRLHSQTR